MGRDYVLIQLTINGAGPYDFMLDSGACATGGRAGGGKRGGGWGRMVSTCTNTVPLQRHIKPVSSLSLTPPSRADR